MFYLSILCYIKRVVKNVAFVLLQYNKRYSTTKHTNLYNQHKKKLYKIKVNSENYFRRTKLLMFNFHFQFREYFLYNCLIQSKCFGGFSWTSSNIFVHTNISKCSIRGISNVTDYIYRIVVVQKQLIRRVQAHYY